MLRSLSSLEQCTANAVDGDLGRVVGFLLDDEDWVIRYFVIANDAGLADGRSVLISPISLRAAEWQSATLQIGLTIGQVKNSPHVNVDEPVSRQQEQDYLRYYGLPTYWGYGGGVWGAGSLPGLLANGSWDEARADRLDAARRDFRLRTLAHVKGHHIHGSDGVIGLVVDLVIDDETWVVRYLTIESGGSGEPRKVLIAPPWARRWEEGKAHLSASRERVKNSPRWDGNPMMSRDYETKLFTYYGHPPYWSAPLKPDEAQGSASPLKPVASPL